MALANKVKLLDLKVSKQKTFMSCCIMFWSKAVLAAPWSSFICFPWRTILLTLVTPPPPLAAAAMLGRLLPRLARLTSGINTWGGQWEVRLGEVSRRPHMDRHGLLFTFNVNIVSCD